MVMLLNSHIAFVYAGEVLSAGIVLPIVGAIIVGLRLWMRRNRKQGIGGDDWLILAALVFVTGMGVCLVYGVAKHAIGYPSPPYPVKLPTQAEEALFETTPAQDVLFQMYWVIWLFMILANGLIKLSAILLYRRIFVVDINREFDILTKVMFAICLLWMAGFFFAQLFGCGVKHFMKPFGDLEQVASCNTNNRLNALMITDLTTDCLVWLLPLTVIWRLSMPLKKKISVTGIFVLAAMSLAAAVVRLIVEIEIADGGYTTHKDLNLTLTVNLYWTMLESGLALIAACLPTMHLLLIREQFQTALSSMRNLLSTRPPRQSARFNTERQCNEFRHDGKRKENDPWRITSNIDSQELDWRRLSKLENQAGTQRVSSMHQ